MDQTAQPPVQHITQPPPPASKRSLFSLIKKYFIHIIIFFTVAITSGVMLANHEANSITTWKAYTSTNAGLTFKHPAAYKIIEDEGWRITVYPSEATPANNIKILYSHKDPSYPDSAEETFLANCQAKKVSEINANNTRIKVYEDSTCGGQVVENSVIVYSENGMNYDIGLFGQINRDQLYKFLSTFTFSTNATAPTMEPIKKQLPISPQAAGPYKNDQLGFSVQTLEGFELSQSNSQTVSFGDKAENGYITYLTFTKNPKEMTPYDVLEDCTPNGLYPCRKKGSLIDTTLGGRSAQSFYVMFGPVDNEFQIVQTTSPEKFEAKMFVAGGGLAKAFQTILSNFKFEETNPNSMTVCTMDALMCPDGTSVGRSGPNCEFVCPK